jgi:hypothetical protein
LIDAVIRILFSSDSSGEEEEIEQKATGQQELVEMAAPWNKDETVDELLERSCDEEDRPPDDDEEMMFKRRTVVRKHSRILKEEPLKKSKSRERRRGN